MPLEPRGPPNIDLADVTRLLLQFDRNFPGEVIIDSIVAESSSDDTVACGNGFLDGLLEECELDEFGDPIFRFDVSEGDCNSFFPEPAIGSITCTPTCQKDFTACEPAR